ncbi:MAG: hypothetical protein NTW66_02115 [Candidatus Magasanikbacteria bacterium]|nr:hypothetical protein [Candidatus Magasanikbacteria bacterium]
MEKFQLFEEHAETRESAKFYGPFESMMKKVDTLVTNGYDMKKVGEIIRLVTYLQDLSQGKKVRPPEPDEELAGLVKEVRDPRQKVQIDVSPDETFARYVYGIIPDTARKNFNQALEAMDIFLEIAIGNSEPTPPKTAEALKSKKPAQVKPVEVAPYSPDMSTDAKIKHNFVIFNKKAPK